MEKRRKQGHVVSPVVIAGRTIARTFWGKAWCDNLESYSDYANRLPRGRTYVRNGSVVHLEIQPGKISALVSGSELYTVEITITALSDSHWNCLKGECSGQIGSLVELLQGRLSKSVMDLVTQRDKGLFPKPAEIKMKCSCPDWAGVCKHIAAVMYGIGARLDEKPELLFVLRKVDHLELIAGAVDSASGRQAGQVSRQEDHCNRRPRGRLRDRDDRGGDSQRCRAGNRQGAGEASRPRYQEGLEESAEAHRHQGEESLGSTGGEGETEQAQNGQGPPAACKPSAPAKASSRKRVKQEVS